MSRPAVPAEGGGRRPLRVLLAAGNREAEGRLVRALPQHHLEIAGRCLDAGSLLERSSEPGIDVVLASAELHRLTEATLVALGQRRLPVVLLGGDPERFAGLARVLPPGAATATIAAALAMVEPAPAARHEPRPAAPHESEHARTGEAVGSVIVVTSGKGAPGKTTLAIALAAGLGGGDGDVALVDADLRGGNVAAYLDLDPLRGLVGLAGSAGPLAERLAAELQEGPGCLVLAGIERPEHAAVVGEELLGAVLAALRERFAWTVVDAGAPADRALLGAADEVLLVCGADLVSVWNARLALPALRAAAAGAIVRAALNRREGREHYGPAEIERQLGVPVVAAVREDRKAARRAIAEQVPLSAAGGGVGRDLGALVAAVEGGRWPATADAAGSLVMEG